MDENSGSLKKFSTNHESLVSFLLSATAHVLVLALILLLTSEGLRRAVIGNVNRRLGVSTVKLEGGSPSGNALKKNEEELIISEPNQKLTKAGKEDPLTPPPKLDKPNFPNKKLNDKDISKTSLEEEISNHAKAISKLNQGIRKKLFDGVGKGNGAGVGNAGGRDQRMVRWILSLNTLNGSDYLAQLMDLGAKIGIQDPERMGKFLILTDLSKRPTVWEELDLEKSNEIFWIDDKPRSVSNLSAALGMRGPPTFFVVFLPIGMEEKLARIEQQSLMGRKELDILETRFQIRKTGPKYEPVEAILKFKQ